MSETVPHISTPPRVGLVLLTICLRNSKTNKQAGQNGFFQLSAFAFRTCRKYFSFSVASALSNYIRPGGVSVIQTLRQTGQNKVCDIHNLMSSSCICSSLCASNLFFVRVEFVLTGVWSALFCFADVGGQAFILYEDELTDSKAQVGHALRGMPRYFFVILL